MVVGTGRGDKGAQLRDVTKIEGTKWEPSPACSARGSCGCKVILAPWLGGDSRWNQWPSMGQKLARPGLPASHSSHPPTPPHQDPCPLPPHCQCHLVHQLYPALHPAQQCCAGRRGPHPSGLHEEPGDGSPSNWFGTPTPLWGPNSVVPSMWPEASESLKVSGGLELATAILNSAAVAEAS